MDWKCGRCQGGNDPYFVIEDSAPFCARRLSPRYWIKAAAHWRFPHCFFRGLIDRVRPFRPIWKAANVEPDSSPPRHCRRFRDHRRRRVPSGDFFGKSFVSPNNGVLLLHDQNPTLPDGGRDDIEWPQYSDVGAMMWWHLYCPVIAHDALFKDHELPLWNRFSMCGLPLLGQGQSMFGDPLNWLPVLTRSAAWSWDLKFLIARWLLCCGLGLTVFALTRHLAASLVVAGAAGFLAFFIFRLNHAANFSLCYSPWILFAWVRLIQAGPRRQTARWCLFLLLVNFSVMNSGTVKEAYMLIACLNFSGFLLLIFEPTPFRQRIRKMAWAIGAGLVLLLVTAPWWRTFVAALKQSWTSYGASGASQIPPARLIGFFDDLFSSQLLADEKSYMPATNFLRLLGVLWAFVAWRDLSGRRGFFAIVLAATVPFAIVFGGIPASAISRVPFVANIISVDNAFSCPLIILTAILAGFGFSALAGSLGRPTWRTDFGLVALMLGGLCLLFFGSYPDAKMSAFFVGYAWSLVIAILAIPIGLHFAGKKGDHSLSLAVLFVGGFLLIWRNGEYLHTPFDRYVFNPKTRVNLHPRSAAVDFVQAGMKEPSRPLGFGLNLFAGYNQMLGWESVLGVDPLRNRFYDDLASALGLVRVRYADRPIPQNRFAEYLPGLDALNVHFYLASSGASQPDIAGLKRVGQFDFDVYESATAWPRAFFTDRLWRYNSVDQFARQLKIGDRRPFAAVQRDDQSLPIVPANIPENLAQRRICPARDYRLTNDTTSFQIDAPSAGIIVLTENYYRNDFRLTVNGKPHDYFRINHAFKGIYVDRPGIYAVRFEYWPQSLDFSLLLASLGSIGLAAFAWLAFRRDSHAIDQKAT